MIRRITLVLFISALPCSAFSQGCSDAGFCTMGAMKPDQPFNKKIKLRLRSIEVSFYKGETTLSPVVYAGTADFNFSLNSRNSFQVKVPYQAVDGHLGKTGGLGDISLSYTRNLFTSEKFDVNFSLGAKIASNPANLEEGGKPLPMYYQTSLGSYDAVAGISVLSRDWLLATGIQHPFNRNKNQFVWSAWSDFEDQEYLHKYPTSKELYRGTDVMLRIERNFRFSRFNIAPGILTIYRLTKDERTNPQSGQREKVDGTTGDAITLLATAGYAFDIRNGIKLLYGMKITDREVNPDGLTRHNVITLSYYFRF